jgi:hypothetical protein
MAKINRTSKRKNQKTITLAELREMLLKHKGTTFAHIVAFTDEYGSRVVKGKRLLQKLTFRNITIGSNYENRVNTRLEKQGDEVGFESQEMSGKTFVEGSNCLAFMNKNANVEYLVCDQEKKAKVNVWLYNEGKKISKEDAIAKNLFAPAYFAEKKTAGRGLVDEANNFFRLTITLTNIIALTFKGTNYIIED